MQDGRWICWPMVAHQWETRVGSKTSLHDPKGSFILLPLLPPSGRWGRWEVALVSWKVKHLCKRVFSLVQSHSRVRLFVTLWTAARQASLYITSPGVCSNSCPSSQRCQPTISSSIIPFFSCFKSFPASGSLCEEQWVCSLHQVAKVLEFQLQHIQGWFPLGLTGWISLQSKGLSRVFSNTTVQKHQFFDAQLSL